MVDGLAPAFYAAYAAVNIKQHVPIVLCLERPNYSKWKAFFTAVCGKYGLLGHIDRTEDASPADPAWSQPDSLTPSSTLPWSPIKMHALCTSPSRLSSR
jgi:hypothetical protein